MIFRNFNQTSYFAWKSVNSRCNLCSSNDKLKVLCKHLGLDENKAKLLQITHPIIKKLDVGKIEDLVQTICGVGFSPQILLREPLLFRLLPITLKSRYVVLQECGLKDISTKDLVAYWKITRHHTIGYLKKSGAIPSSLNVVNNLASHMTEWPTSLTSLVHGEACDYTLHLLRIKIIKRYLELRLDVTEDEFQKGIKAHPTIQHRPLQAINEILLILQRDISMPLNKIKSNFYLLHANPDNLKQIMHNFKSIGGIDIKEIIRMHPNLAMVNYSTMVEIRNILEDFKISPEAQVKYFHLFTLSPPTVKERLKKAKEIPEFKAYYNHPRFLKIILYNNTALKRIAESYKSDKKCLSLNILSGSTARYEVFRKKRGDRLGKSNDLIFYIGEALCKQSNVCDIRNKIKKHPFWINIPIVQVKYVHEKLHEHFTSNDIYDNCQILLYPWSRIRDVMNMLNSKSIYPLHHFIHENIDLKKVTQTQRLSLILYLLEKNHYFSGNGVWTEGQNQSQDSYKGVLNNASEIITPG